MADLKVSVCLAEYAPSDGVVEYMVVPNAKFRLSTNGILVIYREIETLNGVTHENIMAFPAGRWFEIREVSRET